MNLMRPGDIRVAKHRSHRRHTKLNLRWLEQNYTAASRVYDLKLKNKNYNSNRYKKSSEFSSYTEEESMATNASRATS